MKKRKILIIVFIALGIIFLNNKGKTMKKIEVGDKIPSFTLKDENNIDFDITKIKSPLIIYFYPKDETPGCIKEACKFRDEFESFVDLGIRVIGISADNSESHKKFKEKYKLPFTLLADTNNSVRKMFGVPKSMLFLPGRVTYVIDKKGIVKYIFNSQFGAEKHIENSLKYLRKNKTDIVE